jgi:anti-sigma-K factor RskA
MADEPIEELLGAYALDAVDDEERRRVEVYLEQNPRARAEVWEMRQVAAMLADDGGAPPESVWPRIVDALENRPPRPGSKLTQLMPRRRSSRVVRFVGLAAAALVAIGAGVVVTLLVTDEDDGSSSAIEEAYDHARSDPSGRRAALASDDGELHADAVVGTDGVGFLSANALPALPETETYQLWGVYGDGDVISLGVIGNRPDIEPFSALGDIDALVITREQAGGVVSSTTGAVLVGELN